MVRTGRTPGTGVNRSTVTPFAMTRMRVAGTPSRSSCALAADEFATTACAQR
jgi:hypothetical protein